MDPERWKQVKLLCQSALQTGREKRELYLEQACAGNESLRRDVEALLAHQTEAEGFLKDPAMNLAAKELAEEQAHQLSRDLIGRTISHYRIVEKIGEGGMGEVFLAEDTSLHRKVALKFLPPEMQQDPIAHRRFLREAHSAAVLDHPFVCGIHEVGEFEGKDFIVMEHVDGETLAKRLSQGSLPLKEALRVAAEIAEALEQAHDKGVIHRDLKPSNVMLAQRGHVKVMDFGLAKQVHEAERAVRTEDTLTVLTREGSTLGTLAYMSPEQLRGQAVDARSDIFSFGVMFYEMLTGSHPFRKSSPMDTAAAILNKEPLSLVQHFDRAPESLQQAVSKMLAKDVNGRYANVHELRVDLGRLVGQLDREESVGSSDKAKGLWGTFGKRASTISVLVVIGVLGYLASTTVYHDRKARWAREVALPRIEQSIAEDNYAAAFMLAVQVKRYIPQDPKYRELASRVGGLLSFQTTPPGADFLIRDYSDLNGEWELIGRSPFDKVKVPRGFKRWKATLAGYESAEGALMIPREERPVSLNVRLDKTGTTPPEMARIQGRTFKPDLMFLDLAIMPELQLEDFFLDRYEVTNLRFKEFVEAGGYTNRGYWKYKFAKNGGELSWETAMKIFVDKTGRAGPATWELGDYPEGQDDYPVSGVSWFEAAAYAEFCGKSLPTVYHWNLAAEDTRHVDVGYIVPLSNFGGKGPAPVGKFQGMSAHGIYDMAGNVKEWCWNEGGSGLRVITGGAWNEDFFLYGETERYPPLFREGNIGFRCMRLAGATEASIEAAKPIRYSPPPILGDQKPCSDEVFQIYKRLYDYDKLELRPEIELTEDVTPYTRLQKVSFEAAYADERILAYLYIPRTGKPPFQTVIHFPGDGAWRLHSAQEYWSREAYEPFTKTGRAFILPVLQGSLDRMIPAEKRGKTTDRENWIMRVKDFRKTIDYLEMRPEFDAGKLAYEGLSRGGIWGAVLPAIESRIKVAILLSGGLWLTDPPEYSQVNFSPRIHIPLLLENGRYDSIFPVETNQKTLWKLFGTPEKDRVYRVHETGHSVWLKNQVRRDELEFLDKYLGKVR